MRPVRDPEGAELAHLCNACQLVGMKILEVGCGDGKVTRQYAGMAKQVVGVDPEISDLRTARDNRTTSNVEFLQTIGERMPFPAQVFDIVFFASSL
jgi:ubiquinone/menaquinone biosynthesis C-methylase UbiE